MKYSTEQQATTPPVSLAPPDVTRVAGRGTLYVTAAKVWFIVSGLGIEIALTRLMTAEQFGIYRVVIGVVSIINAVIITATYQTVSKHVSEAEEKAASVRQKALQIQAIVGGAASLGVFLLAPVIASYLNDDRLATYFRIAAFITLSYSFYSVFTGYFNGLKRFLTQAILDITYSTLKLVFIVSFAALGYGVVGGVGGFALAAYSILMISAIAAGNAGRLSPVRAADLLKFQGYLLAFAAAINLLQKIDLILIKALSSPDPTIASENAGYYAAAINLANLTYQIVISVTFVVFPLVAQATFAKDRPTTKTYISNTVRYSLMVMALVATLFSANSGEALHVVFPAQFQAGARALSIVAYGILFFGLLYVLTTVISASGRPRVSLAIALSTLAASTALNALLIPQYGMTGAALGTTAAMFFGAATGSGYVFARFGALISGASVIRITLCAAVVYALSLVVPVSSRPLIVGKLASLGIVFVALLVLTKELGREELRMLRKVVNG